MLLGGHGNVSVTANVAPRLMHELCMAAVEGQARRAAEIHLKPAAGDRQLFCELSPAPAKWGDGAPGLVRTTLRLPMVALRAAGQAQCGAGAARGRPGLTASSAASRGAVSRPVFLRPLVMVRSAVKRWAVFGCVAIVVGQLLEL